MTTVTLKDIAKLAGVHPSTVSKILGGKENIQISAETRNKVQKIAHDLDYQPNVLARAFRLKKTNTIGLIIPNMFSSFFSGVARGVEVESYNYGYNMLVSNTDEDSEKEQRHVNNLLSRGVDGLIIAPSRDDLPYLNKLINDKFPFVLIDRDKNGLEASSVVGDNQGSAYKALTYLKDMGHKRIGFIGSFSKLSPIHNRIKGYQKAVKDYELDDDSDLIVEMGYSLDVGHAAADRILSLRNPPTALLTSGNQLTIGVLKSIKERKFMIPKDISLIAYMDSPLAPYLNPPLTTISHPLEDIGIEAFNILLNNMDKKNKVRKTKVIMETTLNIRESVARIN